MAARNMAPLVQKSEIIPLSWNSVASLIRICRIQWQWLLFPFSIKNALSAQIGHKCQNYQFKLKFGTKTNSNMQNSIVMFNFLVFDRKYLFWGKFAPKNQNYQFRLKLGGWPNSNIQNSMVLFTFFVFDRKYSFWPNLVQIVNIVSLRWNLIPTIMQISRIQWRYSLFSFLIKNSLFGQIWSKKSELSI